MLNATLLDAAQKVINNHGPAQFTVVCQFISAGAGSTFSYYPPLIEGMTINRDYENNFADEIELHMKVSPHDYALMQDQGEDLRCVVTITYMDKNGEQLTTPPPKQVQYNVVIKNPRDVRKAMPDIQKNKDPVTDMTVQLIEDSVYKLRQIKINTIFQTCTMTQAIYAIAKEFGITKLHLVGVDNTHVFDHIVIGSYQSISSIFNYLQKEYGLYQKGANAYITEGCLYVYPAYETDPTYDKTAIFYHVETKRYAGSPGYHMLGTNQIEIVINEQPQSFDLSIAGSENAGTGFIFNKASRLGDGLTTIISGVGAMFTEQPSLSVILDGARTAAKGVNNIVHIPSTDNPFPKMSELASHQASVMRMPWMNADPFQLDPCHKVLFYYDENQVMVSKTGTLISATYHIKRMERIHEKYMYGCVGDMMLRLSPNVTKNFTSQ